jgi:putative transposase
MPEYRRAIIPGGTFFITLVTFNRRRLLNDPANVERLRQAIRDVQSARPCALDAGVVLPDHAHWLITLPDDDSDYSGRIAQIKLRFTQALPEELRNSSPNASRARRREAGVWQRRFWEHVVRDEEDRNRLLDYIHYNPVKHGYARCPHAWPHSSFATYVGRKAYDSDWCCCCGGRTVVPPKFEGMEAITGE